MRRIITGKYQLLFCDAIKAVVKVKKSEPVFKWQFMASLTRSQVPFC
jgi:hypothetical protein